MVRFLIIGLSISAIAGPALALPNLGVVAPQSSAVVRIEDTEEPFPHWRLPQANAEVKPEDCYRHGDLYRFGHCVPNPKIPARDKQKPAATKAKPPAVASASSSQPVKRIPPLSEQERGAHAPRPLVLPAPKVMASASRTDAVRAFKTLSQPVVGQLFLSGFDGKLPGDEGVTRVANALRDGKLAGIIVSDANIDSVRQLRELLLAIAKESGGALPLIAIEQPGGPESVLSEDKGFAFYASANAISADRTPHEAQLLYRDMAAELDSLGVNFNIGPSADICRDEGVDLSAPCFGTADSRVAAFATAFKFGHHDRGILTALRHVPFHTGLQPSFRTERATTAILRGVIRAEPSDALVIRTKATEPLFFAESLPGLSRPQSANKLRRNLGYNGAIIFDLDLGVSGAPVRYREAIVRAFQAGADIVLVRSVSDMPADLAVIGYEAVESGIKSGNLQFARIEDAYRHVQRLKERLRALRPKTHVADIGR